MSSNTPIELSFREATPSDAAQIQNLVETAFRTHDSRQDWTGHLELATSFHLDAAVVRANLARDDMVTLLAFTPSGQQDGKDILAASVEASHRKSDHDNNNNNNDNNSAGAGRLSMVAVDDKFQRMGVGARLLAEAEAHCRRAWGVDRFSLDALSTRPALVAWYERKGYVRTGETTPFPRDRYADVDLPEDICFIQMEKPLLG